MLESLSHLLTSDEADDVLNFGLSLHEMDMRPEDGDDELTQWMAHVQAERIHNVEIAPPEERIAAQNSCADLVFQLWAQRYSLPPRLRPLKKLEPLLRTLDALDATNGPRFRFMHEPPADVEVEEDVAKMLGLPWRRPYSAESPGLPAAAWRHCRPTGRRHTCCAGPATW